MQKLLTIIGLMAGLCALPAELVAQRELTTGIMPRIGISPPRIELQLNQSGQANGEFTVLNMSDREMQFELSVVHWDLDEESEVRVIAPTEQSLDQWLLVNPLRFDVSPNGSQTVRFGVRPKVRPLPGEHRAMIYIKEQPDKRLGQGLSVRLNYGLPIYANFGEVSRKPVLHSIDLESHEDEYELVLDIENNGNSYVRPAGRVAVWLESAFPGEEAARQWLAGDDTAQASLEITQPVFTTHLQSQPVLGGTRRQQVTRIPRKTLAVGRLVMVVAGKVHGLQISMTNIIEN